MITHDLTQIENGDFVYVLKEGRVVEQGFRYDLESEGGTGEFRRIIEAGLGGDVERDEEDEEDHDDEEVEEVEEEEEKPSVPATLKHQSFAAIRPLTFGNWMFDVVAELTGNNAYGAADTEKRTSILPSRRISTQFGAAAKKAPPPALEVVPPRQRRPSSVMVPCSPTTGQRRFSLPPTTPTSATFTVVNREEDEDYKEEEEEFGKEKAAMTRSGTVVHRSRRERREKAKGRWELSVAVDADAKQSPPTKEVLPSASFWRTSLQTLPTVSLPLLVVGLLVCTLSGLITPVFSFLLSRLLFEVSIGGTRTGFINQYGAIVLSIAALDGILLGFKYFLMERIAGASILRVRSRAFQSVLAQDQSFFDANPSGSPAMLVQRIIKDGDDARLLISMVWGQSFVVVAMLGVGLLWALISGWQLTLAGLAIAPVFAFAMAFQSRLVASAEGRNKAAREQVAKVYYETVFYARGVRILGGQGIRAWFDTRFEDAAVKTMKAGVRGALVEGCTYGVSSGLIYAAEGMLFYVGAVLISKGLFTYLQMVQVLNLVVFSVTIGSQLMAFSMSFFL